jgi:hypothetical protein
MTGIYVEQSGLEWAVRQGLLSPAQAAALWPALVARSAQGRPNPGGRNLVQVAVYTGSLLVISALTWLLQFASASGACLFVLALAYVVVFGAVGSKLWFDGQARYGIPQAVGGLFVTYAVSVAPVATSAATQGYLDQWPMSKDILTGLTLVAGGACALHIGGIRFPLLTAPIAVGLYCMAVADVAQVAWDVPHAVIRPTINVIVVGVAMNVVGYAIDRRTRPVQDFGFWFYFIGTVSTLEGLVFLLKSPEDLLGPYYCGVVVFLVIYIVRDASPAHNNWRVSS